MASGHQRLDVDTGGAVVRNPTTTTALTAISVLMPRVRTYTLDNTDDDTEALMTEG
jgi:hypothetical protein